MSMVDNKTTLLFKLGGVIIKLLHGDCLELMKSIPDKSIDMILCDLPFGTTQNEWDKAIPFEPLWGVQSNNKR